MNKYLEKIASRREVKNLLSEMIEKGKIHPKQDIATVKGMLRPRTGHNMNQVLSSDTFFTNRSSIRDRVAKQLHDAASNKQHDKILKNFKDLTRGRTHARQKLNEGVQGFGEKSHVWPGYNTDPSIYQGNHTARSLRNMDKKAEMSDKEMAETFHKDEEHDVKKYEEAKKHAKNPKLLAAIDYALPEEKIHARKFGEALADETGK